MKLRGKYLLWFAVMAVMFFAVVSCGCGGGGGSNGGSDTSEDVTVPDNPSNNNQDNTNPTPAPTPSPDSPDVPANLDEPSDNNSFWPDVNGTWKVDAATFADLNGSYRAVLDTAGSTTFDITVENYDDYGYGDVIVFSGEGVSGSGQPSGMITVPLKAVVGVDGKPVENGSKMLQTISAFMQRIFIYEGDNTYKISDMYFDKAHAGSESTVSFPDNSTIEYYNLSTYGGRYEFKATLKRVN